MSYTAKPDSQQAATEIFTVKVTAMSAGDLSEETIEMVVARALAEHLDEEVTVNVDALPF